MVKYILLKKIGEGNKEDECNNVPINREDKLAYPHVKGSSRDDMEPGVPKLQRQHGAMQLELFGYRTPHPLRP